MDLTLYKPAELENWINKCYRDAGIHYASDMDIECIAEIFGIDIQYYDGPPVADWEDGVYSVIFLNSYMKAEQRREAFFHELGHPLRHAGCQDRMPRSFQELQEIQAAHFQLYAAMPIYMFEEFRDVRTSVIVKVLAEEFVLPERFVQRRLEQIQSRIYWRQRELEEAERKANRRKLTDEDFKKFNAELSRHYLERFGVKHG